MSEQQQSQRSESVDHLNENIGELEGSLDLANLPVQDDILQQENENKAQEQSEGEQLNELNPTEDVRGSQLSNNVGAEEKKEPSQHDELDELENPEESQPVAFDPEKMKDVFPEVNAENQEDQLKQQEELQQPLDLAELDTNIQGEFLKQVQINKELFDSLVNIKAVSKQESNGEFVKLSESESQLYFNGSIFTSYLFAMKELAAEKEVQIDLDPGLQTVVQAEAKENDMIQQNWFVITTQLEKIGIMVEKPLKEGLNSLNQPSIDQLFTKVDRYIELTCGKDALTQKQDQKASSDSNKPAKEKTVEENQESKLKVETEKQRDSIDFQEYGYPQSEQSKVHAPSEYNKLVNRQQTPDIVVTDQKLHQDPQMIGQQIQQIEKDYPAIRVSSAKTVTKSVEQLPTEQEETPKRGVKATVDIINMDTSLALNQIENSLEFLLNLLSRHFRLRPLTAAALLTNNNEFLCTAFQQGIKTLGYQPLFNYQEELLNSVETLSALMVDEFTAFRSKKQLLEVLKTISTALYSSQPQLVEFGFSVLIKIFQWFDNCSNLEVKHETNALIYNWVIGLELGNLLQKLIYAIEQNKAAEGVVRLLRSSQVLREKAKKIFRYDFHMHIGKHNHTYSQLVMDLLPHLSKEDFCLEEGRSADDEQGSLVQLWIDYAQREFEIQKPEKYKIPAIALLTELWLEFTDYVDKKGFNNSILQNIRKVVRDSSSILRMTAFINLFRLLECFSAVKNPSAPLIYRSLIFMIIEAPHDLVVREMCWSLFTDFFNQNRKVPVDMLLEPLLKMIEEAKFKLYEFDYSFLQTMLMHPKCSISSAKTILFLHQKLLVTPFGNNIIAVYVKAVCDQYREEPEVENHTLLFTQTCLQQMQEIERALPKPFDVTTTRTSKYKLRPKDKEDPLSEKQIVEKSSKSYCYLLLNQLLLKSNDRFKDQLQVQIIQARQSLQKENLASPVIERLVSVHSMPGGETWGQLVPLNESGQDTFLRKTDQKMTSTALVVYNQQMSTASFFKFKATQHLHKLKETQRQKEERMNEQKLEEIKAYEKRRANLKKQVDKRRVELGVPAITNGDQRVEIKEAQPPQEQSQQNEKWGKLLIYSVKEDFEDIEKVSIDIFIKQKKKLFASLFQKYSNRGIYRVKQLTDYNTFDGSKHINETISLPEVTKILKDAHFIPKGMKKEDLAMLMKMYSNSIGLSNQLQFDYNQFVHFMQQIAWNISYRSSDEQLQKRRPVDCVKLFIQQIESSQPKELLPAETIIAKEEFSDDEIVQNLQQTIDENPDYPLPAGYTKVVTKTEKIEYRVAPELLPFIGRAAVLIVPILDDLVNELFGFHYLEPYTTIEEEVKVKAIMKKPKKVLQSKDAVHIIDKLVNFGPRGQIRQGFTSPNAKVILSPKLELEVARQEPEKRDFYNEVAMTVELLIQAVERGSSNIYEAKPEKIINQALQLQRQQQLQQQLQFAEQEKKRLKRSEQLKELLNKAKQETKKIEPIPEEKHKGQGKFADSNVSPKRPVQASLRNKKEDPNTMKPPLSQKIEKTKPLTDRELAAKRASIKSAKKPQTAQKDPPSALQAPTPSNLRNVPNFERDEVYASNKPKENTFKERAKSVQPNDELLAKRQLKQKEQLSQLQQAKAILQQKEEETKRKEQAFREAIRRRSEHTLQQKRTDRNEDHKFDIELLEFMEKQEVRSLFNRYEKFLNKMYKFYVQQAKTDLGHDINFRMENMHSKEFCKFGFQTKISPVLVSSEQMMQIFRNVARSQQYQDEMQSAIISEGSSVKEKNVIQFINYQSFKKALCRICIYAHSKLGGYSPNQLQKAIETEYQEKQKNDKVIAYNQQFQEAKKQVVTLVEQEMREEFAEFQQKSDLILNRKEGKYEQAISSEKHLARERHENEYARWIKQQESLGRGLKQRVEERMGIAIDVDQGLTSPHLIMSTNTNTLPKQYKQFSSQGILTDQLKKNDLRNEVFQTKLKMDIELLSVGTIEQLFIYLGMEPKLTDFEIDRRLNLQRVEISGQKPTGVLKQSKLSNLKGADENLKQQIEAQVAAQYTNNKSESVKQPQFNTAAKVEYSWQKKNQARGEGKNPSPPKRADTGVKEVVEEKENEEDEPVNIEKKEILPHDPEGFLDKPEGVLRMEDAVEGQGYTPSPSQPKAVELS